MKKLKKLLPLLVIIVLLLVFGVTTAAAQSEGRIEGLVYEDTNGNGSRDDGEPGISDVELTYESGGWRLTVTTGTDGTFGMDLNPGTWVLSIVTPDGYAAQTATREVEIKNPGDTILDVQFALVPVSPAEEGAEGEILPESGGPIPDSVIIGGLVAMLIAGGGLVFIGQQRKKQSLA